MFAAVLQEYARALVPMLIVVLVRYDSQRALWVWGGMALFLVLTIVIAWLRFRNFTFRLDNVSGEFILTEGILSKTKTIIKYERIQQVNLSQNLLQRLISVYAVDVDTAGTQDKEAKIRAVSHVVATELKKQLLEHRTRPSGGIMTTDEITTDQPILTHEEIPVLKIGLWSLVKVGLTSNYLRTLGVIIAFFLPLYENLHRVSGSYRTPDVGRYVNASTSLSILSVLIGFLLLAFLVVNLARVLLRYFGYTVALQQGSLLLSFGLINTKSTIVKPAKVQQTFIIRNYFQKKLDITEMRIRQATNGQEEKEHNALEIPGCSPRESQSILELLYGTVPQKGVEVRSNYRKLVFSIFLSVVVPLSLIWLFQPESWHYGFWVIAPIYAGLRVLLIVVDYSRYRLYVGDRFIIKRSGAWDVVEQILEKEKIQAVTTSQLFWHKKADIGYLTLYTAGGKLSFQLADYTLVKQYVNEWLYALESEGKDWM